LKTVLAFAAVLAAATPARAEWQADLYGGVAYARRSEMALNVQGSTGSADHTFHDVKWEPSLEAGVRANYWLPAAPAYGVGLDFFLFRSDIRNQSVEATVRGVRAKGAIGAIDMTVGVLALDLVRLRHRGDGRLSPYASAGPAFFLIRAKNKGNPEMDGGTVTDTSLGYKLAAGTSWRLAKQRSLFLEYRYTHVFAELYFASAVSPQRFPLRFDLNTHHVVAGMTFDL